MAVGTEGGTPEREPDTDEVDPDKAQPPVRIAHNDYTDLSGPQRVRDLLDAREAKAALERRFAIINVWKPIRGSVEQVPLAVCDARSISPGDLVDTGWSTRTGPERSHGSPSGGSALVLLPGHAGRRGDTAEMLRLWSNAIALYRSHGIR